MSCVNGGGGEKNKIKKFRKQVTEFKFCDFAKNLKM